jgi:two-component system cell cycle response regulator
MGADRLTELENPGIYRSVLESLSTGVYLVDLNRRIVFWNAGAERICGYLRQDVVGRFLREHLFAASDSVESAKSDDYDPLNDVLRDGKPFTAHVSILHKEGYRVPIVLQTVPIRNDRGSIIGAAECFDENVAASHRSRRRNALGGVISLDEITGLASEVSMETHLRECMAALAGRHADIRVVLIRVDGLEHLRATRGPSVVPRVLRVLSHTIKNSLRPSDVVGSWSEGRFLAVLTECDESDLETVADGIRKMISQSEVEWWGDRFAVTAALGGTWCRPDDTLESLVNRAEQSLALSEAAGGNSFTVAK